MGVNLKCLRIPQIEKDVKRLKKKHGTAEKDLGYAQRLLEKGQVLPETSQYPGFGERKIYKTRVINTDINSGKSSGYRLIYEQIETENNGIVILILLYDKNDFSGEDKVKAEIAVRLKSSEYAETTRLP